MSMNRSFNRRDFLRWSATAAGGAMFWPALSTLGADAPANGERPNVLFIMTDDLNDSIAGMGGHPQARTPNINRLMARGVRFTNAQCSAPLCGPSRASWLTGLSPCTTGYFGYRQQQNHWRHFPLLQDARTMMEHFTANGYDVYGTGKIMHGGHEDWSVWQRPDGFDGRGIRPRMGPWATDGTRRVRDLYQFIGHPAMPSVYHRHHFKVFLPLSEVPSWPADPEKGIPGHTGWADYEVRDGKWYNKEFRYVSETDRDLMCDEQSARWSADVLRQKHGRPFMLMNGFMRPHTPLIAPKKYFDMFPLGEIELPPYLENDLDDCAKSFLLGNGYARWFPELMEAGGVDLWKQWVRAYLACVAFVDDQVGIVLDALEKSPYADNTIVIFSSDHGYHMGEKDWLFKNSIWEEATRVPLVVHAPGVTKRGIECDHPVSLLDMYPMLNDLCGLSNDPNADGNGAELDGHSIRPFLEDPVHGEWDGPSVALTSVNSSLPLEVDEPGKPENQHHTVRSRRWRYTLCYNGEEELYDHHADPHEWENRADDPACANAKRELKAELLRLTGKNGGHTTNRTTSEFSA